MGNDRLNIKPGFEQDAHLIPGFIHFAAVDAFDSKHVKDDSLPIDRKFVGRNAQKCYISAMGHVGEHIAKRRRVAGHFHSDVKTLFHTQFFLNVGDRFFANIDRVGHPEFLCKFETLWIYVRNNHVTGSGMLCNGGRHDADRARHR